jgi:hypothetical protein
MNRTRPWIIIAAAAVAALTASCGLLEPDPWADRQAELDANRAVWEAAGITSYTYELRRLCYCVLAGDLTVTVADRAVVAVERADGGPIPASERHHVETIEDLFAIIQDAIDERAFRYAVEFDAELGYPTVVDLDPIRNVVDEEVRYEASDLVPLVPFDEW